MSYLFKCPRCRRKHSVPNREDLKDYVCSADTFVVDNKGKAQNQMQRFSSLSYSDGSIKPQFFLNTLSTRRDFHSEVAIINPVPLKENNFYTGKKPGAYNY